MEERKGANVRWGNFVDSEGVIGFLQKLIQVPSENPPGDTQEIAQIVHEKCVKLGLDSRIVAKDKIHSNV